MKQQLVDRGRPINRLILKTNPKHMPSFCLSENRLMAMFTPSSKDKYAAKLFSVSLSMNIWQVI